jgi:hypothetical protein
VGSRWCARCGAESPERLCTECLAELLHKLQAAKRRYAILVGSGIPPERAREILRRRSP